MLKDESQRMKKKKKTPRKQQKPAWTNQIRTQKEVKLWQLD